MYAVEVNKKSFSQNFFMPRKEWGKRLCNKDCAMLCPANRVVYLIGWQLDEGAVDVALAPFFHLTVLQPQLPLLINELKFLVQRWAEPNEGATKYSRFSFSCQKESFLSQTGRTVGNELTWDWTLIKIMLALYCRQMISFRWNWALFASVYSSL